MESTRDDALDAALSQFTQTRPVTPSLLPAYFEHAPTTDLLRRSPSRLASIVQAHADLALERGQGESRVRVTIPEGQDHTAIDLVTDDLPFVVDSVSAVLTERGLPVSALFHPQLAVVRDDEGTFIALDEFSGCPESWVHLETKVLDEDARRELTDALSETLQQVGRAVNDWQPMREAALQAAQGLRSSGAERAGEGADLLEWMADDNFLFLSHRSGSGEDLGIVDTGTLFDDEATDPGPLSIGKAELISPVHRPAHMDCVRVTLDSEEGPVRHDFHGLFTSSAYNSSALQTPVARERVAQVLQLSGFEPGSHSGRDLVSVLETLPRDELLQADAQHLFDLASRVSTATYRQEPRVSARYEPHGDFVSVLAALPRDRFSSELIEPLQQAVLQALGGGQADVAVELGESPSAIIHFVVRDSGAENLADRAAGLDASALEDWLTVALRTWEDDWHQAVRDLPLAEDRARAALWSEGFSDAYRATYAADVGVQDALALEALGEQPVAAILDTDSRDGSPDMRRLTVYAHQKAPLSQVMPILTSFGPQVLDEQSFAVQAPDGSELYVLDFGLRAKEAGDWLRAQTDDHFIEALEAVWQGRAETDSYNSLVLSAGLSLPEVDCLRMVGSYIQQTTPYSRTYVRAALVENPAAAAALYELFRVRLDPGLFADGEERSEAERHARQKLDDLLTDVPNRDQDQIIRAFASTIEAIVRTNAFQRPRPAELAMKLKSERIGHLPLPRPKNEIWVYSPELEGVHLRFGDVARGGLRWSDRREDFRTEVLGLVKAQAVKNAVIVPEGAKGGFVLKNPPQGDVGALREAGAQNYDRFVGALLSLTDNIVEGQTVAPRDTVRHDSDDPYLVVAADKGTAAFSDRANAVAQERGFWLDDAFASGGKTGYDHKAMGITARGAWESVKRHFLELGTDVQNDEFTVVGVGDMSGDVFGNGMLLSDKINLVSAFDHRHIFVDPDPQAAPSFKERQRLAELPGSSWDDYDRTLIAEGGGVFPRSAKSVDVTPQMRQALGIEGPEDGNTQTTPDQLIHAILKAPVDLLWNGGIGTYVKSSQETNQEVGDPANDSVRVNGEDLRVRVVGEGGNLGISQMGRIEAAKKGILLNTDAIDNSGGVESSDREVNIKILVAALKEAGLLDEEQRIRLLASMTDEVAAQVLRTNYEQNVLLNNARHLSDHMLGSHERFMKKLEAEGALDRSLEFLPDTDEINRRRAQGAPLTSPELSVLTAYSKQWLKRELLASDLLDDPWFETVLADYFPAPLRGYRDHLQSHRLRREIIATQIANAVVGRGGITFVQRAMEELDVDAAEVVRAFVISRELFGLAGFAAAVEELDGQVPTAVQAGLYIEFRKLLDRAVRQLVRSGTTEDEIAATIEHYRDAAQSMRQLSPETGALAAARQQRAGAYEEQGVPGPLAEAAAGLADQAAALEVADLAAKTGTDLQTVARVYFELANHD